MIFKDFINANNLSQKEICGYLYLPMPENGCRKEGAVRLCSTIRRIIKIPPCLTTGWERFYMKKTRNWLCNIKHSLLAKQFS